MSKITDLIFKGAEHYITSPYGTRINPKTKIKGFHKGTDYGTHLKKLPQYAIEDGIVLSVGESASAGKYVWIKYPRLNVKMCHYHLDVIYVKKGQSVNSDTKLGLTGTTGQSTGIHLHLGIFDLKTNKYHNPEVYAKNYTSPNTKENNIEFIHKVVKGDTLYKLAKKYNTTIDKIMKDNTFIKNKNLIKIGWKLVIK